MQVSLESTSRLGRKMTVELPPERIDPEVEKRLKSMSRRVRVAGFRPGKVPFKIVKQRFGEQVLQEVTDEVLRESFQEAVAQQALRPAGGPRIEPSEPAEGRGLKYTATFEVYPEFELAGVEDLEIKLPVTEITEADVDVMMEKLRKQRSQWVAVERPAQKGDRVTIDFNGLIDGQPFADGHGKDLPVELGSGRMLGDFEDQLIGAEPGDSKKVQVTFPDNHHKQALAGKTAEFDVQVKGVAEAELPALDDEFAKSFGVADGGVEALRKMIRANMEREVDNTIKAWIKAQVMEGLLQRNEVELPETMVAHEIKRLRKQAMENFGQTDESRLSDDLFVEEARRRVKLGLIVGEIVRKHGLKPDGEKVQSALQTLAASYADPQQVINYYRRNPAAMANIEAMVLEDQVVDWVRTRAKTSQQSMTFMELANSSSAQSQALG
jgi:trigger factor